MENEEKREKVSVVKAFAIVCKQLEGKDLTPEELEIVKGAMTGLKGYYKELAESIVPEDLPRSMKEAIIDLGRILKGGTITVKDKIVGRLEYYLKDPIRKGIKERRERKTRKLKKRLGMD